MQITLIAIGKMSRGPTDTLIETYVKRLLWGWSVKEIELKRPSQNTEERKKQEAEKLLEAVPVGAAIVALDERGKALSSRAFAGKIGGWQADGRRSIAFLIGGADGLDKMVRQKADLTLALGSLTWPHMMVRLMLAEQTYRAWSILNGHPYHRD